MKGVVAPKKHKMKRRCTFELQFCELEGVSSRYDAVRLVVDHRDGQRRYAASEAIKTSFGTASVSSLSFQCGVYPSKVRLPHRVRVVRTTAECILQSS